MKFSMYINISDLAVGENKGVKSFDFNISQEMTPEEFIGYVEMVPAAIAHVIEAIKDTNTTGPAEGS